MLRARRPLDSAGAFEPPDGRSARDARCGDHPAPEPLLLERRALRDSSGKAKTESPRAFAPRRSRGDCRRIAGARTAGGSVFVVAR
ncbi:hypothetical protein AQ837_09655 [Burkholderia pseudomallei]|nr:metallophosphoesterase [Burkholderia pseudomallei MSHR346]EQA87657.1 hypothetical protein M218_18465 [Burkholderia pseudomallei MSHR338]KIX36922.1 hypothetical protein SZ28_20175 [Burkholderia pseudomallei]KIX54380.1 hypothetical protein SZ29_21600 [Burkholderia pseudomallei]OMT58096.1 hypothetical protein AQ760_06265 [Burkholderia pseudomallei]